MKLAASFAILAVLATKTFVAAAPIDNAYDSVLEARAELTDGALEEVWDRFYDELLEEVEAREYEDELMERAPMKKFVQDLGIGLAQKLPSYAKQYTQSQQTKIHNQRPSFASVVQQAQAQQKSSGKKRSLEDNEDYIFQRAPMKKFVQDLGIGLAQKLPSYAKQYTQSQQTKIHNQRPSFANVVKQAQAQQKSSGKKRSLEDNEDYIFQRAPMKKFATDLATNLAQKAPTYAKQYSQSQQSNNRNQQPRLANVVQQAQAQQKTGLSSRPSIPKIPEGSKWNTVKKPSVLEEVKKLGKK